MVNKEDPGGEKDMNQIAAAKTKIGDPTSPGCSGSAV